MIDWRLHHRLLWDRWHLAINLCARMSNTAQIVNALASDIDGPFVAEPRTPDRDDRLSPTQSRHLSDAPSASAKRTDRIFLAITMRPHEAMSQAAMCFCMNTLNGSFVYSPNGPRRS